MKVRQGFVAIVLMTAITHIATGFALTPCTSYQELLNTRIDDIELEASNIGVLLSELSDLKGIPIGLEVSPHDDLSKKRPIRLQLKHGTLGDALESIVRQNPLYTWTIRDEVVNVLPVEVNRDQVLRDVLETKLEKFSIQRGMRRFTFRQTLSSVPAIRAILTQHNVVADNESFMSRDFAPLGKDYGLEASNVSVAALLNQLVRESQTKYWVVLRHGDRKQYFVLNL